MKFDVVTGNPPYNIPGSLNSGSKIWQKFITTTAEYLSVDGHMLMVTPARWRMGPGFKRSPAKAAQKWMFEKGITNWGDASHHFEIKSLTGWWLVGAGDNVPPILKENQVLGKNPADNERMITWYQSITMPAYAQTFTYYDRRGAHSLTFGRGRLPGYVRGRECPQDGMRPHLNTGAQTRKGIYEWHHVSTPGLDVPKVIIHDCSGPEPVIDMEGRFGLGTHAYGYQVKTLEEAEDVRDFFLSDTFHFINNQFEAGVMFKTVAVDLFKKIPKNWREI